MKSKAAIAYAAGKLLEAVTVDLEGSKAGEVLVEIAASGVCLTEEFTRSRVDPEGPFPVLFGHEGAGIVVDGLITQVMPLEKINDAFDLMHRAESIRSAIITF